MTKKPTNKETKKSAGSTTASGKKSGPFTDEEKEAIAAMQEPDRSMASRIHTIIKAAAPALSAKTWYGMPAYAKDDKVVCFFQSAQKFKSRYATFGFSDTANLDEGSLWPVAFALKELNATEEAKISALVKKAEADVCFKNLLFSLRLLEPANQSPRS